MKKRKHVHTDFIKFIIEKYSNPKLWRDEEEETQDEIQDEDENDDYEIIEEPPIDDEENDENQEIEDLLNEYKKVKKYYESRNRRIPNRRK